MKPFEIFSMVATSATLPATPDEIIDSPAFAMPCRLGEEQAMLRPAEVEPADTIDLAIRFGDEAHTLRLAKSPRFPELAKVWDARGDVPEPILLALVEKECGALLQMLENAVRKQLRLDGISRRDAEDAETQREVCLCVSASSAPLRENEIVFALSRSATVVAALGSLRNIDLAHETIRSVALDAEVEYAAFAMPDGDVAGLAPGDAVLLPEIGSVPPRLVVAGLFVADESGVAQYKEDAMCRVRGATGRTVTLGELFDGIDIGGKNAAAQNEPLRLVRGGKTVATGRLDKLAAQQAFIVEAKE